jgi:hypothetical protein
MLLNARGIAKFRYYSAIICVAAYEVPTFSMFIQFFLVDSIILSYAAKGYQHLLIADPR